ncbi:MAG: hypothetical protein QXP42_02760 [Candidatus Micrarchaeia archaeon]
MRGCKLLPIIFVVFLLTDIASSYNSCPFGMVNDTYPGSCGRYVDKNADQICDYSQPAPIDDPPASKGIENEPFARGMHRLYFVLHSITAVSAAILILYLGVQFSMRKPQYHKEIAYFMAIAGFVSLASSFLYGISFDINLRGLHNLLGFASFLLSLMPFITAYFGRQPHCALGYITAFLAVLSIISGFVAYWDVLVRFAGF